MYTENQIDEAIVTARLPRHLRRKQRQAARQEQRALRQEEREARQLARRRTWMQNFNRAKQLITNPNYRRNFITRHFGEAEEDVSPTETFENSYGPELVGDNAFVDLSQNAYSSTGETPKDATSVLGSEFMEEKNPAVFTAAKWRTLPSDYMLRDWKDMPLSDIRLFYGVEDGALKVAPLDQFKDSTVVVPSRTPWGNGGLTSITGNENWESQHADWRNTRDSLYSISNNAYDNWQSVRDSLYFDQVVTPLIPELSKYKLDPDLFIGSYSVADVVSDAIYSELPDSLNLSSYVHFNNPASLTPRLDSLRQFYKRVESLPQVFNMQSPQLDSLSNIFMNAQDKANAWVNDNPEPSATNFTFENGRSSGEVPYSFGKFLLGNSKGGFYVNGQSVLNNSSVRNTLDNFIKTSGEPLYPVILDNGAFHQHILDTIPQSRLVPKYLDQGYGVRPDSTNIFVIGTKKPSHKKGGILKCQGGSKSLGVPYWTNQRLNYRQYTPGTKPGVDACAAFSNQELRDLGADMWGNAWNLSGELTNVLNGYAGLIKPFGYNRDDVEKYNGQAADNVKSQIESLTLDPNEAYAVNMYFKNSPSLQEAFETGMDTGTHTGMLMFNNETMRWEVVHNIHNKVYVDALDDVLGSGKQYGITSIYKTHIPEKEPVRDFTKSWLY